MTTASSLIVLTLWMKWYGYQMVMGNSQASAKDFVFKAVRAWIIIAFATGLAASMGFSIRAVTTDLTNLISESLTGDAAAGACTNSADNDKYGLMGCKIDKNLARTQAAMAFVSQLDAANDPVLEDKKARASLFAGAGIGGPAIVAGALMLTLKVSMALFICLGPIFIMCLLFKQTSQLFWKWLYYGLATMFATAMLAVVSDIAMDLVENISGALFVSDLFTNLLGSAALSGNTAGIMQASMQQLGLGLILSTLLISTPPMAAQFFNGVMGSYAAQNHLTNFGAAQTSMAHGAVGGYGAAGVAGARGANGAPAPGATNTGASSVDASPRNVSAQQYLPQTNVSVNQDVIKPSSDIGNASKGFASNELAQSDKSVKDQAVKAGLIVVLGTLLWTNGGVQEAKAQACAPGGYVLHLDGYSVCNYIGGNCIQHPPGLIPQACLPQPDNTAPPPVIQKPSSYGAVAWGNGYYGSVVNQATKQNAIDAALQKCGSGDCQVRTTYWNQCVAVSYGDLKAGTSYWQSVVATTKSKAEKDSIKSCSKKAKNCKILLSECSLP